jgi:hypothetical protein
MARAAGATRDEIIDAVRTTRHLAALGVLDVSVDLLRDLAG